MHFSDFVSGRIGLMKSLKNNSHFEAHDSSSVLFHVLVHTNLFFNRTWEEICVYEYVKEYGEENP